MTLGFIRSVALDYDGTLTLGGPVRPETCDALVRARADGLKLILVTGRILDELIADDPQIIGLVDATVAENGAVVRRGAVTRHLAPPIDERVENELARRGVRFRRGDVILAASANDRVVLSAVVAEFGLDVQLVGNRGELMAVPAGITKASGLRAALEWLGGHRHNTVAIGDAENDLAMLSDCEVGVAVANAIDSVKAIADLTTREAAGCGVAEVLSGPIVACGARADGSRWRITFGTDTASGESVEIPAAGVNLLVTGPSGSGKSYVAGLLVEQLALLDYSVFVIDPEGDHELLGRLGGVTAISGNGPFPTTGQIAELLVTGPNTLVIDLSQRTPDERAHALRNLPDLAEASRAAVGRPHWIVIDEAHGALRESSSASLLESPQLGHLLVTYQPELLPPDVYSRIDGEIRTLVDRTDADVEVSFPRGAAPRKVRLATRSTRQIRHWHKYSTAPLPADQGFYFRDGLSRPTGAVSLSLAGFIGELAHCAPDVIAHHVAGREFSRWIDDVLGDAHLAGAVRLVESKCQQRPGTYDAEQVRRALIHVLTDVGLTA